MRKFVVVVTIALTVTVLVALLPPVGSMPRIPRVKALPNAAVVGNGTGSLNCYSVISTYKDRGTSKPLVVTPTQRLEIDRELTQLGFRKESDSNSNDTRYERGDSSILFYKKQWLRIDARGRVHAGASKGHWPYL